MRHRCRAMPGGARNAMGEDDLEVSRRREVTQQYTIVPSTTTFASSDVTRATMRDLGRMRSRETSSQPSRGARG